MSPMFAQYFDYYAIILGEEVRGHGVYKEQQSKKKFSSIRRQVGSMEVGCSKNLHQQSQ